MLELAEGRIELKGAGVGVAEELVLDRQLGLAGGATGSLDVFRDIEGDGPKDLGNGDSVQE